MVNDRKRKNSPDLESRLQEWGRHYDKLFWEVSAIFYAIIVALLGFVYSGNNSVKIEISILGMFITAITVYFASSFRELRKNFQKNYKDREVIEALGKSRNLWQGIIYYEILWVIGIIWINLIYQSLGISDIGLIVIFISLWTVFVSYLWNGTRLKN